MRRSSGYRVEICSIACLVVYFTYSHKRTFIRRTGLLLTTEPTLAAPGLTPAVESVSVRGDAKPLRREAELDFIRGVAILMVLDYHSRFQFLLWPFTRLGWSRFGWAGVDIFFVLSGFLVGGLLAKEWRLRSRIDVRRFLVRRGLKIWPQYYVFLIASMFLRHRSFTSLLGNFLNIQNYVGGIAHTWTLAVEEHAYLLLALLLGSAAAFKVKAKTAFAAIAALAAAVVAWSFFYGRYFGGGFTRTDTRVDGILFGLLLAMLYHFAPEQFLKLQRLWPLWCAILLITLAYLRFPAVSYWDQPLQWLLADLSGISTFLLLYRSKPGGQRSWLYRAIARIGLYSYGIYLWHLAAYSPIASLSERLPHSLAKVFVLLLSPVAAILCGVIVSRLVEFPVLAIRDRFFPRRVDSAAGIPADLEAGASKP